MSFEDEIYNHKSMKNKIHRGNASVWEYDMLPTSIQVIDHALGGGFAFGRAVELYGNWSSGKTMVLYYSLINNIRRGGMSFLMEAEGAFDNDFFTKLGGDPSLLHVIPVDTVEQTFNTIHTILKTLEKQKGNVPRVCIGWDSIAATGTSHGQEAGMDKRDMSKAGAMDQGCKLIATLLREQKVCLIATNQVREKIGSMDSATHTPGGNAYPFLCSQRVELMFDGGSKGSLIYAKASKEDKAQEEEVGRWIRGKVTKSKVAAPFGTFRIPIYIQEGFWHPEGYPYGTSIGICKEEALFYYYLDKKFLLDNKPIITHENSGWYLLHPAIEPEQTKWRPSSWPEKIVKYPYLAKSLHDFPNLTNPNPTGVSQQGSAEGSSSTS